VNPRVAIALLVVGVSALVAIVLAASSGDGEPDTETVGSRYEGAVMPNGFRAPDFRLRDQNGDPISMRGFRGKPVIVTFLYTHCEDTCPLQAQTVKGALAELGHEVPAIAVAVDPPRDTPESARAFLADQRVAGLDWVLGTEEELRPLWKGFAIAPQTVTQEHQSRFTLVDKKGFQRIGFPGQEATPERLAHDIRLLEQE
jgi:protein SCO1